MCGISGIYAHRHAAAPVDPDQLQRLRDHMATSESNAHGEWFSAHSRVELDHRRLAIIDLTEARRATDIRLSGGKLALGAAQLGWVLQRICMTARAMVGPEQAMMYKAAHPDGEIVILSHQ